MIDSQTPLEDLIEGFRRDMIYDCHSPRACFDRSLNRREIMCRGHWALQEISSYLGRSFAIEDKRPQEDPLNALLFDSWITLLQELVDRNSHLESLRPYSKDTPKTEQTISSWRRFCSLAVAMLQQETVLKLRHCALRGRPTRIVICDTPRSKFDDGMTRSFWRSLLGNEMRVLFSGEQIHQQCHLEARLVIPRTSYVGVTADIAARLDDLRQFEGAQNGWEIARGKHDLWVFPFETYRIVE